MATAKCQMQTKYQDPQIPYTHTHTRTPHGSFSVDYQARIETTGAARDRYLMVRRGFTEKALVMERAFLDDFRGCGSNAPLISGDLDTG